MNRNLIQTSFLDPATLLVEHLVTHSPAAALVTHFGDSHIREDLVLGHHVTEEDFMFHCNLMSRAVVAEQGEHA